MITIDLLKNNTDAIPALAKIWHEVLGKIWMPEIEIEDIESLYYEKLNLFIEQFGGDSCTLSEFINLSDNHLAVA